MREEVRDWHLEGSGGGRSLLLTGHMDGAKGADELDGERAVAKAWAKGKGVFTAVGSAEHEGRPGLCAYGRCGSLGKAACAKGRYPV